MLSSEVAMTDAEKESEARCKEMLNQFAVVKKQTLEIEDLAESMKELAVGLKAVVQPPGATAHAWPLPVPAPMATCVTRVDHAVEAATPRAEAALAPELPTKCSTLGPDTNAGDLQVVAESDPETGVLTVAPALAEQSSALLPKLFSTIKQDTLMPTRYLMICPDRSIELSRSASATYDRDGLKSHIGTATKRLANLVIPEDALASHVPDKTVVYGYVKIAMDERSSNEVAGGSEIPVLLEEYMSDEKCDVAVSTEAEFNYVKNIFKKFNFSNEMMFDEWYSQNITALQEEDCQHYEAAAAAFDFTDMSAERLLLFDLTNAALLDIYKKYSVCKSKLSWFSSFDRPKPVGNHSLKELWSKVSCHLDEQPQCSIEIDTIFSNDLAKSGGRWMNFQRDADHLGNKVADFVFDKLLTELTLQRVIENLKQGVHTNKMKPHPGGSYRKLGVFGSGAEPTFLLLKILSVNALQRPWDPGSQDIAIASVHGIKTKENVGPAPPNSTGVQVIAADGTFKTFQAAYRYVVQKVLSDNSLGTRRILYQVIFNKRKELQWHEIAVFLKLVSARGNFRHSTGVLPERKGVNVANLVEISNASSLDRATPERALHTANLCLRVLLSRDNIVIRRLIMTANAKSLARDLISKDALIFRALLSRVLADVVCQWMVKVTGLNRVRQLEPYARMTTGKNEGDLGLSKEASTLTAFQEAVRDRRLKIIFSKFLRDLREEPVLMIRVSWNVFVISVMSAAIGVHRFMVFLSEEYLPTLPPPVPPPRLVQIQSL